jgi:hypothetical protein
MAAGASGSRVRSTRNSSGRFARKKPTTQGEQHDTTVLLQKPATVTTVATKTTINVEQSLHLVQTVLHGCLASILYQRNLFPAESYESRWYTSEGPEWNYSECISGQGPDQAIKPHSGNPILSFKEGASKRTDRLLDLLVGFSYPCLCHN